MTAERFANTQYRLPTLAEARRQVFPVLKFALVVAGGIGTALPFVWMVLSSFKTNADIGRIPMHWFPAEWVPQNYAKVFEIMPFARFYLNSIIVGVLTTLGALLICSLAAYAFARIRFIGRDIMFMLILATIMIPWWVTLIPAYLVIRQLGWLNTYQGLSVPGMLNIMGIFLLRQFFRTIPPDIEDAAFVDGANRLQIYARIVLPMAKPALLTVGLMTLMGSWNSLVWPLVISQHESMRTLPLGLAVLANLAGWVRHETGALLAATFLSILPIVVIYMFLQQYFIRGLALSGLK